MLCVITKREITFNNFENELVVIEAGSEILVDPSEGIAYADEHHFTIDTTEYFNFNDDCSADKDSLN